jgi:RNA polymerase subunit RPABC4/transcription elongation factor Spt4
MVKALGRIGIRAGTILVIIGFLTVFAVIGANLTTSFLAIPIIFMVVGALLIAYGKRSIYRGKVVSTVEPENVTIEPENIFCRYCGSETVSGEYCSACGNSFQSTSAIMKVCRTCFSTMDEDSQYCAHCGMKFL